MLYFVVVCTIVYCNAMCLFTGLCLVTRQGVTTASVLLRSGMFYCLLLRHVFNYRFMLSDKTQCQNRQSSTSYWYVLSCIVMAYYVNGI